MQSLKISTTIKYAYCCMTNLFLKNNTFSIVKYKYAHISLNIWMLLRKLTLSVFSSFLKISRTEKLNIYLSLWRLSTYSSEKRRKTRRHQKNVWNKSSVYVTRFPSSIIMQLHARVQISRCTIKGKDLVKV